MTKDWTGNGNSIYRTLGASNHSDSDREVNDYYATDPRAMELLLEKETFSDVWECACGGGHLSKVLNNYGILSRASDLYYKDYGEPDIDFFSVNSWSGDIITNPPYKYAQEFIEHAIAIIQTGRKVAMFLKVQFLEGKRRKLMFLQHPPKVIYVSSSRLLCAKNGNFNNEKGVISSSAVAYAWFVWVKGYSGDTIIRWIN